MNRTMFLPGHLLQIGTGSVENTCEYCGASNPALCQFVVESDTLVKQTAQRCCLECRGRIAKETADDALVEPCEPTGQWKKRAKSALGFVKKACVGAGSVAVRIFKTCSGVATSLLKGALAATGIPFCVALAKDGVLMIFDLRDAYAKLKAGKMSKPEFTDYILRALCKWAIGTFGAVGLGCAFGIFGPIGVLCMGVGAVGSLVGEWVGRKLADPVGSMIARQIYLDAVPWEALKVGDHILFDGCHSVVAEVQEGGHEISVYEETKGSKRRLSKKQIAMVGDSVSKVNYGQEGGLGSGALREAREWVGPNGRHSENYCRTYDNFFHFVRECRKFENPHPEDRDQQALTTTLHCRVWEYEACWSRNSSFASLELRYEEHLT